MCFVFGIANMKATIALAVRAVRAIVFCVLGVPRGRCWVGLGVEFGLVPRVGLGQAWGSG